MQVGVFHLPSIPPASSLEPQASPSQPRPWLPWAVALNKSLRFDLNLANPGLKRPAARNLGGHGGCAPAEQVYRNSKSLNPQPRWWSGRGSLKLKFVLFGGAESIPTRAPASLRSPSIFPDEYGLYGYPSFAGTFGNDSRYHCHFPFHEHQSSYSDFSGHKPNSSSCQWYPHAQWRCKWQQGFESGSKQQ